MRDLRIGIVILVCAWVAGCAMTSPSTAPGSSPPAGVDVTGTWRGSFNNPSSVVPVGDLTLVLKQTGTKLAGSLAPGGALEGVVDGNKVSYKLTRGRNGAISSSTGTR
jgi:hypothetical protein